MKVHQYNDTIITRDDEIGLEEADEYIRLIQLKFNKKLKWITIELEDEYVCCSYELDGIPFEKIRRLK